MRARLGPAKAITATAHKLTILIYRMPKYGTEYVDRGQQAHERHVQQQTLNTLAKRARQMGYAVIDLNSGEVVS